VPASWCAGLLRSRSASPSAPPSSSPCHGPVPGAFVQQSVTLFEREVDELEEQLREDDVELAEETKEKVDSLAAPPDILDAAVFDVRGELLAAVGEGQREQLDPEDVAAVLADGRPVVEIEDDPGERGESRYEFLLPVNTLEGLLRSSRSTRGRPSSRVWWLTCATGSSSGPCSSSC